MSRVIIDQTIKLDRVSKIMANNQFLLGFNSYISQHIKDLKHKFN